MLFFKKILSLAWSNRNIFLFFVVILPLLTYLHCTNQKHKIISELNIIGYSIEDFDKNKFESSSVKIKRNDGQIKVIVVSDDIQKTKVISDRTVNDIIINVSYSILKDLHGKIQSSSRKLKSLEKKRADVVGSNVEKEVLSTLISQEVIRYKKLLENLENYSPDTNVIIQDEKLFNEENITLYVLLSLLGAIVLSFVIAVLRESLNPAFKDAEEIREIEHLKVLDGLAQFSSLDLVDNELVSSKLKLHNLTEISRIFKYILHKKVNILEIVSSVRKEGNTSLAYALASHSSDNGFKTLLIDMDLKDKYLTRKHTKSKLSWEIEKGDYDKLNDKTVSLKTNLDLLPAMEDYPSLERIKSSKEMKDMLKTLNETYDFIFIDTSDISSVNINNVDPVVLSESVDGVLVNYMLDQTPKRKLRITIENLRMFDSRILAVITNNRMKNDIRKDLLVLCVWLEKINKNLADSLRNKILKSDIL